MLLAIGFQEIRGELVLSNKAEIKVLQDWLECIEELVKLF